LFASNYSCQIISYEYIIMSDESTTPEIELKDIGNNTTSTILAHVEWTPEHENILVEWADKATCFRWLHATEHLQYSRANALFTIPVIIMSTLTGTANFAQDKFAPSIKEYVSMGIGAVNIFAGILTTIQQFLKIGELNEAHRVSSISWGKFYRNIKVELTKAPIERIPVLQMLKSSKEEFDRLMETSPSISEKVIKKFNLVFSDTDKAGKINSETNGQSFANLKKPEICGNIQSTSVCVYKPPEQKITSGKTAILSGIVQKLDTRKRNVLIEDIINQFKTERNRLPTVDEVYNEMDSKVSNEVILNVLKNHSNVTNSPLNDEKV